MTESSIACASVPSEATSHPIPGASLILSPLVNGALMEFYGRWRERQGKDRTSLSTYWGGGVFALGMALVRFWWVTT